MASRFGRSRDLGSREKLLWAMAGGRCEAAGCNQPLWKSTVSQELVPVGQNAHIVAFGESGARANPSKSEDIHALSNLMLLCYACHRRIDSPETASQYPVELLRQWKRDHEARIELVTGIAPGNKSYILSYGSRIGDQTPRWADDEMAEALFPDRFPVGDPFVMSLANSLERDDDPYYWVLHLRQLRAQFAAFRQAYDRSGVAHVSVFALAPQPLLTVFGAMLGDLPAVDVYQRRREPTTWRMERASNDRGFELLPPDSLSGPPTLIFSLSGRVATERVVRALGAPASVWTFTVPEPHNDLVTAFADLAEFRRILRRALDDIKSAHGQDATLHVFPAMPASLAVELGRVRMPKAEMPWRLWDQTPHRGFVPSIDLYGTDATAVEQPEAA